MRFGVDRTVRMTATPGAGMTPGVAFVAAAFIAVALMATALVSASPGFARTQTHANDDDDEPDAADAVCSMETGGTGFETKPLDANAGLGTLRYLLGGICVEVSGSLQATVQRSKTPEPRVGSSSTNPTTWNISPDLRIEAAKATSHGPLKFAFEMEWKYASDTHADPEPTLDEATVAYLGVTLGYTESLMNFWDSGDLQFSATAPSRSSYLVSYKTSWSDAITTAVAVEAGPPASRGETTWQLPSTNPYVTAQLKYDQDDWAFQVAAAYHEVEVLRGRFFDNSPVTQTGWAATVGFTIPSAFVAEDDALSTQFTYAVNSSIFLGTQQDVSFLAANFPTTGPTSGYSGVASYLHNWSDKWASMAFASYLELDVDLVPTSTSAKVLRYGVNVTYAPDDDWTIGAELDYLDARINDIIPVGQQSGREFKGPTGYLWVKRTF